MEQETLLKEEDAAGYLRLDGDGRNLRPAIDALMVMIERVSRRLRTGQPLVILMGETHAASAHISFQLMVLQELKRRAGTKENTPVFCMEQSHNLLEKILEEDFGHPVPPEKRGRICAADRDGAFALKAFLAARTPPNAPVARHTLYHFCLREGIGTRFTDLAKQEHPYDFRKRGLDQDDPFTAALLQKHMPEPLPSFIGTRSPEGIYARNISMTENALLLAQESGSRLILQQCGTGHLFGVRNGKEEYRHSLSATFNRAGAAVLPVFIADFLRGPAIVPPEAREMFANALVIAGMAHDEHSSRCRGGGVFLEDVARKSGAAFEIFDAAGNAAAARAVLQQDVRAEIPAIMKNARHTPIRRLTGFVPL